MEGPNQRDSDRKHKIIIICMAVLLAAILVSMFTGRDNIKAIQTNITMSQKNIDSALNDIRSTKLALDSIRAHIASFGNYVDSMQIGVRKLNETKIAVEAQSARDVAALKKNASTIKKSIVSDTLPTLTIKPL